MIDAGHLFVAQGDLLELACDGVLVPTDATLDISPHWGRWIPSDTDARELRFHGRVTNSRQIGNQFVRYVNTGADDPRLTVKWLRDGVREGLVSAAKDCDVDKPGLHGRERPLIGMPAFGTGAGGFNAQRGAALRAVLKEAHNATKLGIDVAVVCHLRADYSAMQSQRSESHWSADLISDHLMAADELGHEIQRGHAALFLGAGVSRAAGLPDWSELLVQMANDTGFEHDGFASLVRTDPPAAASALKNHLGDRFNDVLREHLPTVPHAIGHALLASLRVGEVITTNVDSLYEQAARVPFDGRLSVLPWGRVPGRPPWLLKMHGDLDRDDLVFTTEQYGKFDTDNGPLGAVVQALLFIRHLIFVGYSLRDDDFVVLARNVARILHDRGSEYTEVGTVLAMVPPSAPVEEWEHDLRTVLVGGDEDGVSPADARSLEIFLDRVAWRAARVEASWLLDQRYERLLSEDDFRLVEALRGLRVPDTTRWHALRHLLRQYGREEI